MWRRLRNPIKVSVITPDGTKEGLCTMSDTDGFQPDSIIVNTKDIDWVEIEARR